MCLQITLFYLGKLSLPEKYNNKFSISIAHSWTEGGSTNQTGRFDPETNSIVFEASNANKARCQFHQRSTSSFYLRRSQKRKKTDNLNVFFTHLGSLLIRAASKTLMKLTPAVSSVECHYHALTRQVLLKQNQSIF